MGQSTWEVWSVIYECNPGLELMLTERLIHAS